MSARSAGGGGALDTQALQNMRPMGSKQGISGEKPADPGVIYGSDIDS